MIAGKQIDMHADHADLLEALNSDDWLTRGCAIRKLVHAQSGWLDALPRLFDLTFDERAPIASDAAALIAKMGALPVPFLLEQIRSASPARCERAIESLMNAGGHRPTYRLADPVLTPRKAGGPDGDWRQGGNGGVSQRTLRQRAFRAIRRRLGARGIWFLR